jgi:hypothetical protein
MFIFLIVIKMSPTDLQNIQNHRKRNSFWNTGLQNARQLFGFISNALKKERKKKYNTPLNKEYQRMSGS